MDMPTTSGIIFKKIIQARIRGSINFANFRHVTVLTDGSGMVRLTCCLRWKFNAKHTPESENNKLSNTVLCIELTDDNAPGFLYVAEIDEEIFQQLKKDQSILVNFTEFPQKLMYLLNECENSYNMNNPLTVTTEFLLSGRKVEFQIIESNAFKEIVHVAIAFTQPSLLRTLDHAVRMFDSERSINSKLKTAFEDITENYRSQISLNENIKDEYEKRITDITKNFENKTAVQSEKHADELHNWKERCGILESRIQLLEQQLSSTAGGTANSFNTIAQLHNRKITSSLEKIGEKYELEPNIVNTSSIEEKHNPNISVLLERQAELQAVIKECFNEIDKGNAVILQLQKKLNKYEIHNKTHQDDYRDILGYSSMNHNTSSNDHNNDHNDINLSSSFPDDKERLQYLERQVITLSDINRRLSQECATRSIQDQNMLYLQSSSDNSFGLNNNPNNKTFKEEMARTSNTHSPQGTSAILKGIKQTNATNE